jgi:hypothetical protein
LRRELRLFGCGDADPSRLYFWPRRHERIIAGKLDPWVYNQRGSIWCARSAWSVQSIN